MDRKTPSATGQEPTVAGIENTGDGGILDAESGEAIEVDRCQSQITDSGLAEVKVAPPKREGTGPAEGHTSIANSPCADGPVITKVQRRPLVGRQREH